MCFVESFLDPLVLVERSLDHCIGIPEQCYRVTHVDRVYRFVRVGGYVDESLPDHCRNG